MEQAPGHTDGPPLKSAILHFCKISSLFLSLPISRNGRLQNGQYFNGRIGWEHKVQTFQQKRKYILDTPISPFSFRHELIFNALGMSPVYLNCTCTSKILKLKCANYKCKSYPSSNQKCSENRQVLTIDGKCLRYTYAYSHDKHSQVDSISISLFSMISID